MIEIANRAQTMTDFIPHAEAFPNWDEMCALADDIAEDTTMTTNYCNGPFHRFYGWDYSELLWAWNMPDINDDINVEQIRFVINQCYFGRYNDFHWKQSFFQRKATKDMRRYVEKLAQPECSVCYSPFWRGLSRVKDDRVFLQMLSPVIGYAWT